MKRVLVNGAGGFIWNHLVRRLRAEDFWVREVDLKYPEFSRTEAHEFIIGDLRDYSVVSRAVNGIEDIYQLAADAGDARYIFTSEHDTCVMHNSATININAVDADHKAGMVTVAASGRET